MSFTIPGRIKMCLSHLAMAFRTPHYARAALCLTALLFVSGCSINRLAANKVGDALAGSGTTFASDDDPELVKSALPFTLKLMESLLGETPRHRGLLLASSSGFTQYAYAFVQQEADELEEKDLAAATALRARARRLYARARNYGFRALELRARGFEKSIHTNAATVLKQLKKSDVPLLYWTAASWAAEISLSKDNPESIANLPLAEAMMDRALVLDEKFGDGAIHSFFITYEMSRAGGAGDPALRSRKHFDRAMELSVGQQAGPLVTLAEAVALQKQDKGEFETLLNRALAINPDAKPEWRLVNLIMQRRARWLLSRVDDLILAPVPNDTSKSKNNL